MSYIAFEAISCPIVHTEPYRWYSFPNILAGDVKKKHYTRATLRAFFIQNSRFAGEKKNYRFSIMELFTHNQLTNNFSVLPENWQNFISELSSPHYFKTICSSLNINPKTCYVDIALYRYQKGDWVTTHIDNVTKIVSQLFYFNLDWHEYWGGQLYLSATKRLTDISVVISPHELTSVAIKRSSQAWHGVFPVTHSAKQDRLCLQYEIWSSQSV